MNPLLRRVESFLMLAFVLEVKEVSITGEQYIYVLTSRLAEDTRAWALIRWSCWSSHIENEASARVTHSKSLRLSGGRLRIARSIYTSRSTSLKRCRALEVNRVRPHLRTPQPYRSAHSASV